MARSQHAMEESTFTRAVVVLVPSATISFGKIDMLTGVASTNVDARLIDPMFGCVAGGEVVSDEHAATNSIAATAAIGNLCISVHLQLENFERGALYMVAEFVAASRRRS